MRYFRLETPHKRITVVTLSKINSKGVMFITYADSSTEVNEYAPSPTFWINALIERGYKEITLKQYKECLNQKNTRTTK